MKKILMFVFIFVSVYFVYSSDKVNSISAKEILKRIDNNIFSNSKKILARMVIYNRRGRKRELKMISYMEGDKKSFSEYLSPKKEKGTKMLKLKKNLWTYNPRTERIIHIAGHLLRQSIMGSDLSYEDSMEDKKLSDSYNAKIVKEGKIENTEVWVLELKAKRDNIAYQRRKLWVDKEKFVPIKENWYGKSGRLLKKTRIKNLKKYGNRWYPVNLFFKDVLKSGRGTEFIMDKINFNPKIPRSIFNKQSLKR